MYYNDPHTDLEEYLLETEEEVDTYEVVESAFNHFKELYPADKIIEEYQENYSYLEDCGGYDPIEATIEHLKEKFLSEDDQGYVEKHDLHYEFSSEVEDYVKEIINKI